MLKANYLKDKDFLKKLDLEKNKTTYVKIIVLTEDELPIRTIEGQILSGFLNIDGNSSMRRTCNLTFIALENENDLTNIDNILSINKKIKIEIGIENNINDRYDKTIWFKQGVYIIVQPSITHNLQSATITLSCKDKMCLLNGECGGALPASVIFNTYDQLDEDGNIIEISNPIYDIIETLLLFYGHENINNIVINDIPKEIKQIVRWTGSQNLYYNTNTDMYTLNYQTVIDNIIENNDNYDENILSNPDAARTEIEKNNWIIFNYNDDIGYSFVDFVYPGELVSGIGESIVSILDKIKNTLGNFEYFYDIDGNFVFQEVKNYLNTSYTNTSIYEKNNGKIDEYYQNNLSILNNDNYYIDLDINGKSIYDFTEGNGLISSYSNSISYTNLKNDFHIWGKNNNDYPIHYHLAIKQKPQISQTGRKVILLKGADDKLNGKIKLNSSKQDDEDADKFNLIKIDNYIAADWRAELYLQGLELLRDKKRPDQYQQEILDLFDSIYDFSIENKDGTYGAFKTDIINSPNNLLYFIDYLEPSERIIDCSIDSIGQKVYTYSYDKINKLYESIVPNIIIMNIKDEDEKNNKIVNKCIEEGQSFSNVDDNIYSKIAFNTSGYAADISARDLLYQYTNYNSTINIQSIPIYYLEPNRRITIYDKSSNIQGDYVIKTISLPLDGKSNMTISATKALERI